MPSGSGKSPVWVRRRWVGHHKQWAWAWGCTEHRRTRGYHYWNTRQDRWLAKMGHPPRPDPWVRAMTGAVRHWWLEHDPDMPFKKMMAYEKMRRMQREEQNGGRGQQ